MSMVLLFNLSFKMSNNRLLWGGYKLQGYHSVQCKVCLSLSHSVSVTEVPSASLSYVLHMSLRDSATAVCFTVSVGGISGIPVCGRGLLPGSPSIHRLSQSCTLLPSLLPSPNLSFCCHTQQNISLSFSCALLHFVFRNKETFLRLSPRWWLTGNWVICCLNSSQIF